MTELVQDVRFAGRLLLKERAFSLTAIATLALCIGAQTTISSVVNSVLLRPLPVPESERILLMFNSYPRAGAERASTAVPDYYDRLREVDVFAEQALFDTQGYGLGEEGRPERLLGMAVTPSFFRLVRVSPSLGRPFSEEEGELGKERKVILSHALWQRVYGEDSSAVGRKLRLDDVDHQVVGVMPEGFLFIDPEVALWTPLAFGDELRSDAARHSNNWTMIGRLKPGSTLEQAQAQIDALNAANLDRFPQFREPLTNAGFHTRVVRLQDDMVRNVRENLYLLWAGVGLVLLIGCVNVANLTLVRSKSRLRELATRFALGAVHARVARQLFTESAILSVVSGALGLALGWIGVVAARALGEGTIPRSREISIDLQVILWTLAVTLAVAVVIGAIPMTALRKLDLHAVLRDEGRTGTGSAGARLARRVLVTFQVGIAFMVLIGAGLLLKSFRQILAVDVGFEPDAVLTATISPPASRYPSETELRSFSNAALTRLSALPAVTEVGITTSVPFGGSFSSNIIVAQGYVMAPGESLIAPNQLVVTPGYFRAMGMPILRGRDFDATDTPQSEAVVIVDDRLAQRFWPGENPVGKRMFQPNSPDELLEPSGDNPWLTVVGVVPTVQLQSLEVGDGAVGAYYFPYEQQPRRRFTFVINSENDFEQLIPSVRHELASLDALLPLYDVRPLRGRIRDSLRERRTPLLLSLAFGAVGLILAAVGIYGALAYLVSQRTRELGIRIALGSEPRQIFGAVLREGVVILLFGLSWGAVGGWSLRRVLEGQLFGIVPLDPTVWASVVLILGATTAGACLLPARRATRIDPVAALTVE